MSYTITTTRSWNVSFPPCPTVNELLNALSRLPLNAQLDATALLDADLTRKFSFSISVNDLSPTPSAPYLPTGLDY